MAVHNIITWGDPRLKRKNYNVENWNSDLDILVNDMFDTLVSECGIGLAAPQIGININIAVIDLSCGDDPYSKILLINPTVINIIGSQSGPEGCLSIPGISAVVCRPQHIYINNYKKDGSEEKINAQDLLARTMAHEIDHLNGRLFIEYLGPARRQILQRQYYKHNKQIKNR